VRSASRGAAGLFGFGLGVMYGASLSWILVAPNFAHDAGALTGNVLLWSAGASFLSAMIWHLVAPEREWRAGAADVSRLVEYVP
jgi:hypothetical protein